MIRFILRFSRYLTLVAVLAMLAAATGLAVYGAVLATQIGWDAVTRGSLSESGAKGLVLACVELMDLFLLATVLYVTSVGLYELFIDPNIPVPAWMRIRTLDDLKEKLIAVVIVAMTVLFFEEVVVWEGERNLLTFGGGIAAVIAALTYFLSQHDDGHAAAAPAEGAAPRHASAQAAGADGHAHPAPAAARGNPWTDVEPAATNPPLASTAPVAAPHDDA